MSFQETSRKASADAAKARLEREWRELNETINGLVQDMADVKERLARLEMKGSQSTEAGRHPQSDSDEQ